MSDHVDSLSEGDDHNVFYEPSDRSDFIIHFHDVSFHLHSQIVSKESKYFAAACLTHSECKLHDRCALPSHSCIKLDIAFGSIETSVEQLKSFLDLLYDPTNLLHDAMKKYPLDRDGNRILKGVNVDWVSGDSAGTVTDIDENTIPGISVLKDGETKVVKTVDLRVASFVRPPYGVMPLWQFLNHYTHYVYLAHYFDCPVLLRCFKDLINNTLKSDADLGNQESIDLLVLCDRCNFDDLLETLLSSPVTSVFETLQCFTGQKSTRSLRHESLAIIVDALLDRLAIYESAS